MIALLAAALWNNNTRMLALTALALVLISGLIGLYQSGMQWGILPGPSSCSGQRFVLGSNMTPIVQCDAVTWQLFGLSLAAYNAIFSFLIAGLGGLALLKAKNAP
jgi:disulfide bond formation protein DsbB